MGQNRSQRFRVNYGPSQLKALCVCGAPYYGHRPKGGACYDASFNCTEFRAAKNRNHRWGVAPRKTVIFRDHKYDSQAECDYARELQWRLEAGDIEAWEPHPLLNLEINGVHVINYRIDFLVRRKDGIVEYVEVKGAPARSEMWRFKWKLATAMFRNDPNTILRLVSV